MPSFALPSHQAKPGHASNIDAATLYRSLTKKHQRVAIAFLLFLSLATFSSFLFDTHKQTSTYMAYQRVTNRTPTPSYPLSRAFKEPSRAVAPIRKEVLAEPLHLTPEMELAALVAFLTDRDAQNALPATIDPKQPIPPDVILDFDTRSHMAQLEVEDLVQDTWIRNPIVIFSKVYSPQGRDVKKTFASYKLKPAPAIINIDERVDAAVLEPLLYRLTGQTSLPITLLGGRSLGSPADISKLHESGDLQLAMKSAGVKIIPPKKKKAVPVPKHK